MRRITYAAKAGHPYTSIGKVMIERGDLAAQEATMTGLREWFDLNPGQVDEILWHNRSYIFFREAAVDDPRLGPVAAAKVPLGPGRSLAVDRLIHTFSTPFFIRADRLNHLSNPPFRRLMIAQDTGSAIVGPARGDIFVGTGDAAGEKAGSVNHAADFVILIPVAAAERYR
jgi:membrane-bound lytic murein transglycosylase A